MDNYDVLILFEIKYCPSFIDWTKHDSSVNINTFLYLKAYVIQCTSDHRVQ